MLDTLTRAPDDLNGTGWRCLLGDVLARLADLPAASVHLGVTSSPYWGLRAYGTAPQVWGGDPACVHGDDGEAWEAQSSPRLGRHASAVAEGLESGNAYGQHEIPASRYTASAVCAHCGGWRGELGAEPLPDCLAWARAAPPCSQCFVCHLRTIAAALWRVLRPDGSLVLNLGDSYGRDPAKGGSGTPTGRNNRGEQYWQADLTPHIPPGVQPKGLIGVPWRVALALQADGWTLREDIIWAKRAPMPESVRDRCTRAHEYLFHFTKGTDYYWDAVAIAEPAAGYSRPGGRAPVSGSLGPQATRPGERLHQMADVTRNMRSVWTLGPEPNPEAHFATFPSALPERVVLAATSAHGCCPDCGAPWERALWRVKHPSRDVEGQRAAAAARTGRVDGHVPGPSGQVDAVRTVGWHPTCAHYDAHYRDLPRTRNRRQRRQQDAANRWWPRVRLRPGGADWPVVPATVLDPFAGSGTTIAVAVAHGRTAVGIELNPAYAAILARRMATAGRGLRRARPVPTGQISLFGEADTDV